MTTLTIPIGNIHPSPYNPRFSAGDLSELAVSVREEGFLQNPRVREAFDELGDGQYILEAGWRRWSVARLTGLDTLECNIAPPLREGESAQERALVVGIAENGHREKLHPLELTQAFVKLRDECKLTQAQISRRTGYSISTVSQYLSLSLLSPTMQEKMNAGKLTKDQALKAVKTFRSIKRKERGHAQVGAQWDPDHFCATHRLASKARNLCRGLGHNKRRLVGDIACGACWESVIRHDEEAKQKVFFDQQLEELAEKRVAQELATRQLEPDTTVIPLPVRKPFQ